MLKNCKKQYRIKKSSKNNMILVKKLNLILNT